MLRLLAIVATVLGIIAGQAVASAADHSVAPSPSPPADVAACQDGLATHVAITMGTNDAHDATVIVTRTAGAACRVAEFPQIARATSPADVLPVGRISLPLAAVVDAAHPAAFVVRTLTIPTPPRPRSGPRPAPTPRAPACAFTIRIGGSATTGSPLQTPPCATIIGIAVSGLASGTLPPAIAPFPPATSGRPCLGTDLSLRDAGSLSSGAEIFALQNVGPNPCRIASAAAVTLLDAHGTTIRVRFAPHPDDVQLLPLAPGYEASFTLAVPASGAPCLAPHTIAVTPAGAPAPLTAPLRGALCVAADTDGPSVSRLRLGVALRDQP